MHLMSDIFVILHKTKKLFQFQPIKFFCIKSNDYRYAYSKE